jgi:CheY-like chemotaxis protein
MNAIIGMAGIGEAEQEPKRKDYCFGKIKASSQDLLDIINNMLDMVKFEHGVFELAVQEFDLAAMLGETVKMFKARAAEKKQTLSADIAPDMPSALISDEKALRHVFVNILGNAVKFTPRGGDIRFAARMDKKEGRSGFFRFEISDTGIGINPEHQEHLWEAFEQQESGISRRYGGVGLGLIMARNIVRLMGGEIQVFSEPGKGSTFTVTLKADIPVREEKKAPGEAASRPDAAREAPFAGRTFLLVDDIELNREIVTAMLAGTGAFVDCAANGKEAVSKFSASGGGYDLILMDLHMPGMDGFEAARRIRASGLSGCADIPIIAVTADTGGEVITKCKEAGMNAHVGKPIDMDELIKTIAGRLSAARIAPDTA